MEKFSNEELLLMSQVLNDTLLEYEELKDEQTQGYTEKCFNLLQKVIRNINE